MSVKNISAVLSLTFLLLKVSGIAGSTINDAITLRNTLLSNYSKDFRPIYNQSEPLYVNSYFDIVSLAEVNEVQETFTVTGIVYLIWNDSFFTWDPNNYGGIDGFPMKKGDIWTPEIIHSNPSTAVTQLTEDWHDVRVTSSGQVSYAFGQMFSSVCSFNIRYYPMDRQKCDIQIALSGYLSTELINVPLYSKIQTTYLQDNGAWDLIDTNVEILYGGFVMSFQLVMDRKSGYVIVNVIIPIILMSVLNILIFLIPTESGERVSYSITILLAIAVLLTVVSDNLPKTSDPMAIYSYYLLSVLIMSLCITVSTIISLRIYHNSNDKEMSDWWKWFVKFVEGGHRCKKSNRTHDNSYNSHPERRDSMGMPNGDVSDKSNYKVPTSEHGKPDGDDLITWACVSIALDKVFILGYSLLLLVLSLIFTIVIATGD